jgi:hypothetical protein
MALISVNITVALSFSLECLHADAVSCLPLKQKRPGQDGSSFESESEP